MTLVEKYTVFGKLRHRNRFLFFDVIGSVRLAYHKEKDSVGGLYRQESRPCGHRQPLNPPGKGQRVRGMLVKTIISGDSAAWRLRLETHMLTARVAIVQQYRVLTS